MGRTKPFADGKIPTTSMMGTDSNDGIRQTFIRLHGRLPSKLEIKFVKRRRLNNRCLMAL